jgi:hypothetical protein
MGLKRCTMTIRALKLKVVGGQKKFLKQRVVPLPLLPHLPSLGYLLGRA